LLLNPAIGVSVNAQSYTLPATIGEGPDVALAVVRWKGVVLDSLWKIDWWLQPAIIQQTVPWWTNFAGRN